MRNPPHFFTRVGLCHALKPPRMIVHRSSLAAFLRAAVAAGVAFFWDLYLAEGIMRVSLLVGVLAVIASFQPSLGASVAATYHAILGTLIGAAAASAVVAFGSVHPAVIGSGLLLATPLVVVLTWRNLTEQRLAVGSCALFLLTLVIENRNNSPINDPYSFILEGLGSVSLGCVIGTCAWALTPIGATADELVKHKLRSASATLSLALRATISLFDVDAEAQSMSKREAAADESPRLVSRVSFSRRTAEQRAKNAPSHSAGAAPWTEHSGMAASTPVLSPHSAMPKARVAATPLLRNYQYDFLDETQQNLQSAKTHLATAKYELPARLFAVRKLCEAVGWLFCGASSCCAITSSASAYAQEQKWIFVMSKLRVITKLQQFAVKLVSGSPLHVLSVQGLAEALSTVADNQATLLMRAIAYETRHDGWWAALNHHPDDWPNRVHHDAKHADPDRELQRIIAARNALVQSLSLLLRRYAIVRKATYYTGESEVYKNTTALLGLNTIMFGAIRCSQLVMRASFSPRHIVGESAPTEDEIRGHTAEQVARDFSQGHIAVCVDSSDTTPRSARQRGVFASDGADLSCCKRWGDVCTRAARICQEGLAERLFRKIAWQRAFKMTVAILMVSLLALLDSGFEHTAWGPLAVAFAANSNDGNTFASGLFRLEGTVLGALLGYFSIRFAFGVDVLAVLLLAVTVGAISGLTWNSKSEVRSVAQIAAFTSAVIALGAEVTQDVDAGSNLALSRIEQNVLGVVGLLLVVVFIFPNRKSDTLPPAAANMLRKLAKATGDTSILLQRTLHTEVRDKHGRTQSGIKHAVEVPAASGDDLSDGTRSLPTSHTVAQPGALGSILGADERARRQVRLRDAALALYHVGTPGELDSADKFLAKLPSDISDASKDLQLLRRRAFPTGPWRRLQRVVPKLVVNLRLINQCRIALALQRADVHSRVYARLTSQRSIAPDASLDESIPGRELQYCTRQMMRHGDQLRRLCSTHAATGDELHDEMDLTAEDVFRPERSSTPDSADSNESRNSSGAANPCLGRASTERGNSNEDNPFVFAGLLRHVTTFLQCAQGTILQASIVLDAVGSVVEDRTWCGLWLGSRVPRADDLDRDTIVAAIEKLTEDEARMIVVCTEFLNAYDSTVEHAIQTVAKWLHLESTRPAESPDDQQNPSDPSQANDKIEVTESDQQLRTDSAPMGRGVDPEEKPAAARLNNATAVPGVPAAADPPQLSEESLRLASRNIAAKSLISNAEAIYFSAIGFALQEMTQRISDVADAVSDIFVRCSSEEYDAAVRRKLQSTVDYAATPRARHKALRPELQQKHGCLYGLSAADESWFRHSDSTLRAMHATTTYSDILRNAATDHK